MAPSPGVQSSVGNDNQNKHDPKMDVQLEHVTVPEQLQKLNTKPDLESSTPLIDLDVHMEDAPVMPPVKLSKTKRKQQKQTDASSYTTKYEPGVTQMEDVIYAPAQQSTPSSPDTMIITQNQELTGPAHRNDDILIPTMEFNMMQINDPNEPIMQENKKIYP